MPWPTWDQAAIAAVLSVAVTLGLRRLPQLRVARALAPATLEFALLAGLYSVWRVARVLPLAQNAGAIERARRIDAWQHDLHLPSELSVQHFVLQRPWLSGAVDWYYAVVHVPALLAFLLWLFVRHRGHYVHWRTGLVLVTAGCLVIRFVRVAPPRFLPDLGYVDPTNFGAPSLYGPVGTGVSDQFAAMPSIHVGWAAVVALGAVAVSRSRWRWLVALHLPVTMFVVAATANHWWLDGLVAIALLLGGRRLDTAVRGVRRLRAWLPDINDPLLLPARAGSSGAPP